jgi:transaldolase
MSNRAVFLDRDGVLNVAPVVDGRPGSPRQLSELHIAPGAPEALACLRAAGFRLIVVTNQPEVARGKISLETLDAMHAALRAQLPIDEIRVCLHDKGGGCDCRKPRPGMITDAARDAGIELTRSYVIGDRWRDVEAGRRAGCRTVLIDYGYDEPEVPPDYRARSIREAADWVLKDAAASSPQERLGRLRVKLFCDGADLAAVRELAANPLIKGFTTNPTLMRKAGVASYEAFARDVITIVAPRPVSLEVFADEADEMERQARTIAGWGENVYVKIPVTNTRGDTMAPLVGKLAQAGVKVNVTAVFTLNQVGDVASQLLPGIPSCVSIFAGRIADAGRDPEPIVAAALTMLQGLPNAEVIWASPRELLNIFQADRVGCHIITVSSDLLKRIENVGRDFDAYSLDTVRMFFADAGAAGYRL